MYKYLICQWNSINRELLPTSGIRAGLSAITPAAFLPIPGILLASTVHCQTAPSVCQWHEKSSLCVHAIPNPNPELFFCCIFMREFRICLKPYFLWALFWWAAACYVVKGVVWSCSCIVSVSCDLLVSWTLWYLRFFLNNISMSYVIDISFIRNNL